MDQRTSDLRARLHPAKLPTCEKELKKILSSDDDEKQKANENVLEQRG